MTKWSTYKTQLADGEITRQLLDACEEDLSLEIYRHQGDLLTGGKSEEDILKIIKEHAVKIENLTISRKNLMEARQDKDEPIGAYVGRLKGLASMCQLTIKSTY